MRFSFSFALAFLTPSLHLYALLRWHVFVSTVCACLFTFSSTSSSQLSLSRPCLLPSLSNVLLLGIAMLLSWRSTPLFLSEISLVFPCGSVQTPWLISLRLQVWSRVASTVQSHCKEPSLAPCPSIYLFSRLLKWTSLILPLYSLTSSSKPCQWAPLFPKQRLSSTTEEGEPVWCQHAWSCVEPFHCQNPQNFDDGTGCGAVDSVCPFLPMMLPSTVTREENITHTPDSLTKHPKALKSFLAALGLCAAIPSVP